MGIYMPSSNDMRHMDAMMGHMPIHAEDAEGRSGAWVTIPAAMLR